MFRGVRLGCAYCIRRTYGLWDANTPAALMTDTEAVEQLVSHRYFRPHKTPLQIFNRPTDPLLAGVRDHLFAVLEDLDARGLPNHVLVRGIHRSTRRSRCRRTTRSGRCRCLTGRA